MLSSSEAMHFIVAKCKLQMCKKYVPETWKKLLLLILKTFVFTSPEHVSTVIPAFCQLRVRIKYNFWMNKCSLYYSKETTSFTLFFLLIRIGKVDSLFTNMGRIDKGQWLWMNFTEEQKLIRSIWSGHNIKLDKIFTVSE